MMRNLIALVLLSLGTPAMALQVNMTVSPSTSVTPGDLVTITVELVTPLNTPINGSFDAEIALPSRYLRVESGTLLVSGPSGPFGDLYWFNAPSCGPLGQSGDGAGAMGWFFDSCVHPGLGPCGGNASFSGDLFSFDCRVLEVPAGGQVLLTGVAYANATQLLYDTSISIMDGDCDGDNTLNLDEIAMGAPDLNNNGVPDECEVDIGIDQDVNGDTIGDSLLRPAEFESEPPLAGSGSHFGVDVDVDESGDLMLVGAPGVDYSQGGSGNGEAKAYRRISGAWVLEATWSPPVAQVGATPSGAYRFGERVAISGDTAVVAARGHDGDRGAVYVYVHDGTSWSTNPLILTGSSAGGRFGTDVDVLDDRLIVGAPWHEEPLSGEPNYWRLGKAFVYKRSSGGSWPASPDLELLPGHQYRSNNTGLMTGSSVAVVKAERPWEIERGYIVGMMGYDDNGSTRPDVGGALFYREPMTPGVVVDGGQLLPIPDCAGEKTFLGKSVAVDDYLCAIGGDGIEEYGSLYQQGAGLVAVYDLAPVFASQYLLTAGTFMSILEPSDRSFVSVYGSSLAVQRKCAGAARVLVGAREDFSEPGTMTATGPGAAYLFEQDAANGWSQSQAFELSSAAIGENVGASVALASDLAFVGAPRTLGSQGSVAIFSVAPWAAPCPHFVRGYCNSDNSFNLGDPVFLLGYLFQQQGALDCEDACDANDDGGLNIADAVYMLTHLFNGGADPLDPFPNCDEDPTGDSLDCEVSQTCPW